MKIKNHQNILLLSLTVQKLEQRRYQYGQYMSVRMWDNPQNLGLIPSGAFLLPGTFAEGLQILWDLL